MGNENNSNTIEFAGDISKETRKVLLAQRLKGTIVFGSLYGIFLNLCVILVAYYVSWYILIYLVTTVAVGVYFAVLPVFFKNYPDRILIKNDIIYINITVNKINQKRKIANVKKVFDLGSCYYIVFYFPHKSMYFVCQKDLLIEGSLEEFEKLFEGKIQRKEITK